MEGKIGWKRRLLQVQAWITILFVLSCIVYIIFGLMRFDINTWSLYLNVSLSSKLTNLLLFFGSLLLFDFSIDPPGMTITAILEDKESAWKFMSILTIMTGYVLGLT